LSDLRDEPGNQVMLVLLPLAFLAGSTLLALSLPVGKSIYWTGFLFLLTFGLGLGVFYFFSKSALPESRKTFFVLVISALAAAPFFFSPLGDDTARYRWEGWSFVNGGNPYTQVPQDHTLEGMPTEAKKLWSGMNHKNETAIYGPVFILGMALWSRVSLNDAPYHLLVFAGYALILFLLQGILRERKLGPEYLFLASLNPLFLIYVPGEGHNEAFILPLLLAACLFHERSDPNKRASLDWFHAASVFCLGLMLGIKLTTLVFLPLLLPRSRSIVKALIHLPFFILPLAAYLPFAGDPTSFFHSLGFESRNFHYNDSLHYLLRTIFGNRAWIPGLVGLSVGFALIHLLIRDRLLALFWGAFLFLLFSLKV